MKLFEQFRRQEKRKLENIENQGTETVSNINLNVCS